MATLSLPRLSSIFALLACLAGWTTVAGGNDEIRVVTEELPPFNMTVNDKLTGMSTEIVEAVFKELGIKPNIQSMPWARAYDMALHSDNVLIYSITHTPERDPLFKWVGDIAPTQWYLYSLAGKPIRLSDLEQARAYQIATVKEDVGEQYLTGRGFVVGRNLQSSNKYEFNYEKLQQGHVDLWISNELNAFYLVRQAGEDPARLLVRSLSLPELGGSQGLSMAFSRGTPDATVEKFRSGLKTIRENGTYAAIARKWQ